MRVNVFLFLVATFAAACIGATNAKNIAQVDDIVSLTAALSGDNYTGRLRGSRELASGEDWWVSDENDEERVISADKGAGFFFKLKNRLNAKKMAQVNNAVHKADNIDAAKVKDLTAATANAVKKNRKIWPRVKKGLKVLYGATLAALIIVGVQAMLE